jgi:hypothetical protein
MSKVAVSPRLFHHVDKSTRAVPFCAGKALAVAAIRIVCGAPHVQLVSKIDA